jgi:hypothetical protein
MKNDKGEVLSGRDVFNGLDDIFLNKPARMTRSDGE